MSIRQRNGIWWIDLRTPSGERVRRSTGTDDKRAAQEYHDRLKAELWRVAKLGDTPQYTFEQAAVRFLQASEGQKDYATKVRHIKYWRDQFAGRAISSLTTEEVIDALPTHAIYKNKGRVKLTPATRNRYLATIRRIISLCAEWGWISHPVKLRPAKEPTVRVRWITQAEATALVNVINKDWLKDVTRFALATGMRSGEILSLEWSAVDLSRNIAWVSANKAKSKKARGVPLNPEAVALINAQKGIHPTRVFTRNGNPQKYVDPKMFARACKAAAIVDFHFHDLRHTWASWHVQAGTPLFVLKELGGWETLEMVKKYAHMDATHLAPFANAVTFWSHGTPEKKTATG
ncbi:tyrosine-type recombinase/integrase [Pusillimonas minor]|uniref:Site-specific integrase n=1 Tax=Pusillimonas minor TaxID=2697024 RepID=A0A842HMV3_9BURK|nr:site-specific integrase [Pusillimonas minor]MBC2768601.1 site-specific integrase [Pusillimonas minor]